MFGIKAATEPWELAASYALRREVFCREQQLFTRDDRDERDADARSIVAVTYVMGMAESVVGTVRVHEHAPRRWTGSRLAIDERYRGVYGLGAALVRRAVETALAAGCDEFLATVQQQNVPFFRRLHWTALRDLDLYGAPHTLMQPDLRAYGPLAPEAPARIIEVRRAS